LFERSFDRRSHRLRWAIDMRAPDITSLLETCYGEARSHERWASDVVSAFRDAFRFFGEVGMYIASLDAAADTVTPTLVACPPAWHEMVEAVRALSLRESHLVFYPAKVVTTMSEMSQRMVPSRRGYWADQRAAAGVAGGIAMVVHPMPATALVMFADSDPGLTLDRRTHTTLARLALHVESGFRLRAQRGAVRAVIGADGRLVDGALTERQHVRFASAARAAEAARKTRDPALWTALVAGHISVVPRMRGSRRVYELVENARAARPVRALSRREVDVLELASTGLSTKLCSYALGLSTATISTTLGNAARKVGALNQLELLRIAALLAHDPRADANDTTLTAAERDILELIRHGLSNVEIASRRRRSVRTIANQVASLLRKTGSPSRRALVTS
jgi:DNA-binding CsgD family transcriptional regulator